MKAATIQQRWLIADIGGTNSRLAIWATSASKLGERLGVRKLRNADFTRIEDMLGVYLDHYEGDPPTHAVLAIAGPVTGGDIRMVNIDWSFKVEALRQQLQLTELIIINDFEALAHLVPVLQEDDFIQLGDGDAEEGAPALLIGPGTGLGVASVVFHNNGYVAVPGEGGHVSLAAASTQESEIIEAVRQRHGHCSAERVLSGAGLSLLHDILHQDVLPADEISKRANRGDAACCATFKQFFLFLGTVASNAALTLGANGGVYLGGGVLPANRSLFEQSGFRERFVDKGRYRQYLSAIPTRLIILDTPALTGLSALAANRQ